MLVNGEWKPNAFEATNEDGEFDRQETSFRDRIESSDDATFPAEPNRYHIYISRAGPWAHRTAMIRRLKGLTDLIGLSVVEPIQHGGGWEFSDEYPDPIYGEDYLREIYLRADPNFTGRVTVPVLWDIENETIVNNESVEIMRMIDTEFHSYGNGVDLYPTDIQEEIDRILEKIYSPVNNGVYRAGFAESQEAYDRAVEGLFEELNYWEDHLDSNRYLAGDRLTEADLAMFATLVRFDHVYHTIFKCNRRAIHEMPNLWNYTKELAQIPEIQRTIDMDHIMDHYYTIDEVNPQHIVATGPEIDFEASHDRDRLTGDPPAALASVNS